MIFFFNFSSLPFLLTYSAHSFVLLRSTSSLPPDRKYHPTEPVLRRALSLSPLGLRPTHSSIPSRFPKQGSTPHTTTPHHVTRGLRHDVSVFFSHRRSPLPNETFLLSLFWVFPPPPPPPSSARHGLGNRESRAGRDEAWESERVIYFLVARIQRRVVLLEKGHMYASDIQNARLRLSADS
jgi:hypothetical protein